MSKKDRRRQQLTAAVMAGAGQARHVVSAPAVVPAMPSPAVQEEVTQLLTDAMEVVQSEDLEAPASSGDPTASVDRLRRDAVDAKRIFDAARKRMEAERTAFETRRRELTEKEEAVKRDREAVQRERAELATEKQQLLDRAEQVTRQEQDALSGFSERRWALLERLREEEASLQERLMALGTEVLSQTATLDAERRAHIQRVRSDLETLRQTHEEQLRTDQEARDAERLQLLADRRELELDRRQLLEDRRGLERQIAREVERQGREVSRERDELAARVAELIREGETLRARLVAVERLTERFGGREPQEILVELARLTAEVDRLREELGNRPPQAAGERLHRLELAERQWGEERATLRQRVAELEATEAEAQTAGWQVAALRREREELEQLRELQEARLEKLRREIQENLRNATDANPFRAFRDMDDRADLQQAPATKPVSSLAKLTTWLRYRIAEVSAPNSLYYEEEDLRLFIAGMAMSPLMILQGVSGTGKTSLPLAFAHAVGGGRYRHPVQAGWRDKHDLLGHFNSFEGRFYASGFLQALYEAQTPAYADRPYIIVLDEMNLSSPEQYFADFLSEFEERQASERKIRLLDQALADGPRHLVAGNAIRIPENVWFVGTANHDETTVGFAPKTYDRAHVMELTRRGMPPEEAKSAKNPTVVSLTSLRSAFAQALQDHRAECTPLLEFIYGDLQRAMHRYFRIGWGQRLERQILQFLPAIRACGGTVSEAADHILTTKIARNVRHRHDNRPEHLDKLAELIEARWSSVARDGRPVRTLALLADEKADRQNDVLRDGE